MNASEVCDKFLESLDFDPYLFQEEAILSWFGSDRNLLLCAPTGMGKTLIAEAAVFEALHTGANLYYTTPLIALTDQKFRDLQDKAETWGFSREAVGLITGNRRVNPEARIRVVVAEILLNHLLAGEAQFSGVGAVVIDEFHYFNDFDRGIVWELTLVLTPKNVRMMLLSATVGNPVEFIRWLDDAHGRKLQLIQSSERKVPLEFNWVADKLLTEQLPAMITADDESNRTPALVFCFNRDACWETAERLKGLKLIDQKTRILIEQHLSQNDFAQGIGPKLRQMLICGVGVHHAGVLPKHKQVVEALFLKKLIPIVVCTETLAAGINLPARSVVLAKLLKGKPGEEKLIPPSAAHQMFGRAGRPQFDKQGYVYALAHEDDVKIAKWRKKYDQIDPNSKDPGILRARKDLERKKPSRRKTEKYWSEGQFKTLIETGPTKLFSRSMIPYQVLIYLLTRGESLKELRKFLSERFNTAEKISGFQKQLDYMLDNLAAFGFLRWSRGTDERERDEEENGDGNERNRSGGKRDGNKRDRDGRDGEEQLNIKEGLSHLLTFRSINPLYGHFLVKHLVPGSFEEKVLALESVLPMPSALQRSIRLPEPMYPGPLQTNVVEPELIQMGILPAKTLAEEHAEGGRAPDHYWAPEEVEMTPGNLPEMLKALFDAKLSTPEDILVQAKWVLGGILDAGQDFYKYIRSRDLAKNEGLVMRHLLRLVILAGEFCAQSDNDPDYLRIGELATNACQQVDASYTERFLASEAEAKSLTL